LERGDNRIRGTDFGTRGANKAKRGDLDAFHGGKIPFQSHHAKAKSSNDRFGGLRDIRVRKKGVWENWEGAAREKKEYI